MNADYQSGRSGSSISGLCHAADVLARTRSPKHPGPEGEPPALLGGRRGSLRGFHGFERRDGTGSSGFAGKYARGCLTRMAISVPGSSCLRRQGHHRARLRSELERARSVSSDTGQLIQAHRRQSILEQHPSLGVEVTGELPASWSAFNPAAETTASTCRAGEGSPPSTRTTMEKTATGLYRPR